MKNTYGKLHLQIGDVALDRLTHDDIELVRQWRNSETVRKYMEFRSEITPEMQEAWFRKIDNDNNFYFIISVGGKKIGLQNLKDVDYEKRCAEGGIFLADEAFLDSGIGMVTSILINDFAFGTLKLDYGIAHILRENKRAIRYNKYLGLELQPGQENVHNQLYHHPREAYYERRPHQIEVLKAANLIPEDFQ